MNNLDTILSQLESKISHCEALNENVSQANVGWHIEHSLLVLDNTIKYIALSDPKDYKWSFNFLRIYVMTMKSFPRGKAKAPKSVRPETQATTSDLLAHIASTRTKVKKLNTLSKDQFMVHPFFGNLKLKKTIKFLGIHTNHHLKIIDDIIKN